jgi:hypothetical protein
LLKALACVSYRFGGDATAQTLIEGGIVTALLHEMSRGDLDRAGELLDTVKYICSGSLASYVRVRFTARVTEAVAREVFKSSVFRSVLRTAHMERHSVANVMSAFLTHTRKLLRKEKHCVDDVQHDVECVLDMDMLIKCIHAHPGVMSTPIPTLETESDDMLTRRTTLANACYAFFHASYSMYDQNEAALASQNTQLEADDRVTTIAITDPEWAAMVQNMCVAATPVLLQLLHRIAPSHLW